MYRVYGSTGCIYCVRAKALLQSTGLPYVYVDVATDEKAQALFKERGWTKVPQIFENDRHVGGFDDLVKHLAANPT